MKTRTKNYLDALLANPKISNTEAYIQTHRTINRNTARVNASKLLAKTNARVYMEQHADIAKKCVVSLIGGSVKDEIRLRASQDVLDRFYGKATQSISKDLDQITNITISLA